MKRIFHIFLTLTLAASTLPAQGMWQQASSRVFAAAQSLNRFSGYAPRQQTPKPAVTPTRRIIAPTKATSTSYLPVLGSIKPDERSKTRNYGFFARTAAGVATLAGFTWSSEKLFADEHKTETIEDPKRLLPFFEGERLRKMYFFNPKKRAAKKELLAYIKKAQATNSILELSIASAKYERIFEEKIPYSWFVPEINKPIAPTLAHIYLEHPDQCSWFYNEYEYSGQKERLKSLVKKIVAIETDCLASPENYYSYVHAQDWSLDLAQRIYAELYASKNKEFFPLHFLPHNQPDYTPEPELITLLHQNGACYETHYEKHLLSVNGPFFCNSKSEYDRCNSRVNESSAAYFLKNRSIQQPRSTYSLRRLLDQFGHSELYWKYQSECDRLEQLHREASAYGKLWVIKIPKAVHQKLVIPTKPYGSKTKIIIDGQPTDDVNFIQDTLRIRPEAIEDLDRMQFRIIMKYFKQDLGIKTIPLHCADPVKYAEFEKALYALMAKIRADIAAKAFIALLG